MSFVITTIVRKSVATAHFLRDMPKDHALRVQAASIQNTKSGSGGFIKRDSSVSPDGMQVATSEVWATKEQHQNFMTANDATLDAFKAGADDFNTAEGNTVLSTSAVV